MVIPELTVEFYELENAMKHFLKKKKCMDFERCAGNITAGKKQCLNQDSHPESLPDRASTNLAEQLKPDISTDILTPVNVSN